MHVLKFDHTLPSLPVQELDKTCENLKQLIRPLTSDAVWEATCAELDRFFADGGDASVLQRMLLEWKAERAYNGSWLRPFWDDSCLAFRDRIAINMNFTYQLNSRRWGKDCLPRLASALTQAIVRLGRRDLPPEETKAGPVGMDTVQYMIYTRTPDVVRDNLFFSPLSGLMTAAVVCNGHWYAVALKDKHGEVLAPAIIKNALDKIRKEAEALPTGIPIGAITAAPRETAHKLRSELQQNLLNRTALERIEKSLFVICLDEPLPAGKSFGERLVGWNPENRWYDKSLELFYEPGGTLGASFEHAGCDAGTWSYLLGQADEILMAMPQDDTPSDECAHIRPLRWNVTPELVDQLQQERDAFMELAGTISYCLRSCKSVSRDLIRPKKCSPDAFIQILFQATYYKLTGRFRSVYESVTTRKYFEGRTDCIRSCTTDSTDFISALVDGSADNATLCEKLRRALDTHAKWIGVSQDGLGPERHMHGLNCMYQMQTGENAVVKQLPAIFEDEGYLTLRHDSLSTSSVTTPFIDFFGFGPVVSDGIGIGYGLTADSLNLMVSAYPESSIDPTRYMDVLEETATQMLAVLD